MIVREDSMTLYGFADTESRDLFGLLQTVSGVGPRLAMATLAVLEPEALRKALADGNVAALTRVPGIGKRGAERMVLELRDKVEAVPAPPGPVGTVAVAATAGVVRDQVVEALIGLGFAAKQAEQATDKVLAERPEARFGRRPACRAGPARSEQVSETDEPSEDTAGDESPVTARYRRLDGDIDASLRPQSLDEFIGQPRVREQLQLVLAARRCAAARRITFCCPDRRASARPLAMIIAAELGSSLRVTSGPALERAGDLAAMLSNLVEDDVLFIDEIHRIARPAEEMLYLAMEDFRVDVIVGKGPGATSIPLEVAPFTLVGATTRSGALTGPLRDRFGFTAHMDFYDPAELRAGPGAVGAASSASSWVPTPPPRSPAARAAPPGSPTGCCAGSATTPRSAPTA